MTVSSCLTHLLIFILIILYLCDSILVTKPLQSFIPNVPKQLSISFPAFLLASFFINNAQCNAVDSPVITSTVLFDISINRKSSDRVSVGLYGNEAPTATKLFLSICKGENAAGVSYDFSQVSRIIKNNRIDVAKFSQGGAQKQETWLDSSGKMRLRNVDLASSAVHSDVNNLRHDVPGRLSVPKGGKSFAFTINPKENIALDEENVVIGKVINGMDVIQKINMIPVSREDALGSKGGFSNVGKNFDGRAKLATVDRPLQKIQIVQCQVEEKASIASFLKF